ncbi:TetR/AcrR family transcriptional regulator [Acetanaerobacterium elongatum]|uniref:Transcriptional regulator, TetR family n=1 Tax=Acetanaerobacterium elongatum TaxID=258515 RepID=A0A1G9XV63_9FIRM|nr:TetR/AcrR family transcriptional regulator [Acetanaerobacterium elongatum]SDN00065.1 transcriptional regulator, TetR family [Acetanaerobacterium elongatum]
MLENKNTNKRKKGLETQQQILEAASDLFARNGYEGVSVREIAEKVGIKESSLYNHFKSKSDILETLFDDFIRHVPETRPSDQELDNMLMMMEPEEVFKAILFHVGKSVNGTLSNTAMIINYEKFRNQRAAEMYYQYVINEPAGYYERLINKMIDRKMVKPVDARLIAEQYNYISVALTKEFIMARYGFADIHAVVAYMVKTLKFFCGLMKNDTGDCNEKKEE